MQPIIVWLNHDLRIKDNPALFAAREKSKNVIPVFILNEEGRWAPGGATKAWLQKSLKFFADSLKEYGLTLILKKGKPEEVLEALRKESGAHEIYTSQNLKLSGVKKFPRNLLFELGSLRTKEGKPYQVFTPFWKASEYLEVEPPLPEIPKGGDTPRVSTLRLEDLGLTPHPHWDRGFWKLWEPGEKGAHQKLRHFLKGPLADYSLERDFPANSDGVSHLSPHLHFGEISARTIYAEAKNLEKAGPYLRQLVWREFAYNLLFHFPHTADHPLRPAYEKFPWVENTKFLEAWQKGETGYPIVDAGMRELWETGWMHNRVRMIVGSFLVKDLLLPWLEGARFFWDTLVDADLPNNTLGWQWVAGCGADAAPYFRVFNPTLQGQKFDPEGLYVKKYCPELKSLPPSLVHEPWKANLFVSYPSPIVDHAKAKAKALEALHSISK